MGSILLWCTEHVVQVWLAYVSITCYNSHRIRCNTVDGQHTLLFQVAGLDSGRSISDSEFEALAVMEIEHTINLRPLNAGSTTLDDIYLAFSKAPLLDCSLEAGIEGFNEISKGAAYHSFEASRRIVHVKSWHALLQRASDSFVTPAVDVSAPDNNDRLDSRNELTDRATTLVGGKRRASVDEERPSKRQRRSSLKLGDDFSTDGGNHKSVHLGKVRRREEFRIVSTNKEVSCNNEDTSDDDSNTADKEVSLNHRGDISIGLNEDDWGEDSWDDATEDKSSKVGSHQLSHFLKASL